MKRRYWLWIGGVLVLGLVLWAIYISSKQLARNQRIETEVSALKQEAEKIKRENETLTEKVHYFASDDFREQEAKEKLGMKKTGEEVVIIKSRKAEEEQVLSQTISPTAVQRKYPNYEKWWRIFFQAS